MGLHLVLSTEGVIQQCCTQLCSSRSAQCSPAAAAVSTLVVNWTAWQRPSYLHNRANAQYVLNYPS